jgi:hypothetical protein
MTKEPTPKPKIERTREPTDRELTDSELDAVCGGISITHGGGNVNVGKG